MPPRGAEVVSAPPSAPFSRRLAALFYEALLLFAVLWCAGLPVAALENELGAAHVRALYQLYLAAIAAVYFVWQWTHGGQTLAMKAWRLKLVSRGGGPVTLRQALVRYAALMAGLAAFGITFFWALADRDRVFLHDRIAGTLIATAPPRVDGTVARR